MAFTSKIKSSLSSFSLGRDETSDSVKTESFDKIDFKVSPKLTRTELNKLAKSYPSWLRDNSSVKNLPAIYKGVLGQVQSHPAINIEKNQLTKLDRFSNQNTDYLERFTDTQRVHQLLLASKLSNELLAIIWAHVNKSFPGKLTNREVCLALALIAIFQRCETDADRKELLFGQGKKDLFMIVKAETKPPIPKLHSTSSENRNSYDKDPCYFLDNSKTLAHSRSINDLGLLVDLTNESYEKLNLNTQSPFKLPMRTPPYVSIDSEPPTHCIAFINSSCFQQSNTNLMDLKIEEFERTLSNLCNVWSNILIVIKRIFKKTFDILSVNHARQSAIESLTSVDGIAFIKHISLLYPLAHNIKQTLNQIDMLHISRSDDISEYDGSKNPNQLHVLDRTFVKFAEDLMTSINEYWAVLINLFHECSQTTYIEYIMDGLHIPSTTAVGCHYSLEDLGRLMDTKDRSDICSICHKREYILTKKQKPNDTTNDDMGSLTLEDLELLTNNELITDDKHYYYHAKCGSFWLNNLTKDNRLPFDLSNQSVDILLPTKCD